MSNKKTHIFGWLFLGLCVIGGCDSQRTAKSNAASQQKGSNDGQQTTSSAPINLVMALGRLEPKNGVVPIVAAPGDRIEEFTVLVGEIYPQDHEVALLAGRTLLAGELATAKAKLEEAEARQKAEEVAAEAKLAVAAQALKANELKLKEAEERLRSARSEGGEFDLLKLKIDILRDALENIEKASTPGPAGRSLATKSQLKQQELTLKAAQYDLISAERDAENSVQVARLQVEASVLENTAVSESIKAAKAAVPIASAKKQIQQLESQIEAAKLQTPIAGTIVSIDASVGQPTAAMPIMRIADLDSMICRAEVPVQDIKRISIDDKATISGGGLLQDITGTVTEISMLVGTPMMNNPNPMAPVDYKMVPVVITIDKQHAKRASLLVHTQVSVSIQVKPNR